MGHQSITAHTHSSLRLGPCTLPRNIPPLGSRLYGKCNLEYIHAGEHGHLRSMHSHKRTFRCTQRLRQSCNITVVETINKVKLTGHSPSPAGTLILTSDWLELCVVGRGANSCTTVYKLTILDVGGLE